MLRNDKKLHTLLAMSKLALKSDTASRSGIQSVEVGMRVVEAFVASDGALQLREVAKATGLGPSAVHRYLVSLVRSGLLVQLADQRYDLGPLAVRLGFAGLSRVDALDVASHAVDSFVEKTGTTAMLSVWSERGPLVVKWRQGARPVYTTIAVGSVLPLDNSATGQVFAAWRGIASPRSKSSTAARNETVRNAGYAVISGDLVPGLNAISAPVLDGSGALVAAITAVAAGSAINPLTRQALILQVEQASAALGYRMPVTKG